MVALEDSSLIQVNVEMHKPNITVQGRRDTVLSPVQVRLCCQIVAVRICNRTENKNTIYLKFVLCFNMSGNIRKPLTHPKFLKNLAYSNDIN